MGSEALREEVGQVGKNSTLRGVGRRRLPLWISFMLDPRWEVLDMLISFRGNYWRGIGYALVWVSAARLYEAHEHVFRLLVYFRLTHCSFGIKVSE